MRTLFPVIAPSQQEKTADLPLFKEVAWDFKKGNPIFKNGEPVYIYGSDALKVWIWLAIKTPRTKFDIFSWDFGCEILTLVGQNFIRETKEAEAARYIQEALSVNPYLLETRVTNINFKDATLSAKIEVETIYGEVEVNV